MLYEHQLLLIVTPYDYLSGGLKRIWLRAAPTKLRHQILAFGTSVAAGGEMASRRSKVGLGGACCVIVFALHAVPASPYYFYLASVGPQLTQHNSSRETFIAYKYTALPCATQYTWRLAQQTYFLQHIYQTTAGISGPIEFGNILSAAADLAWISAITFY